jgi:NADPH:quinone reductase-like Zn-dependent oxidoreductase
MLPRISARSRRGDIDMAIKPSKTTMRAWAITAYGEPMRLMELPVPTPGSDDLLIRMHGAEVGDWDDAVRTGEWPMERPFPLVLGLAGAGRVVAMGDTVEGFAENEPVYAYGYPLHDNGAWAEYMLVPASYAARAPTAIDLIRASALPIVGLTAHETVLDTLQVKKGEVVLITAAAGGVGHLAVQIAASAGARVVATAGRRNLDFVRDLGAEIVIDHTSQDVIKTIRAQFPDGVDKALNGVAGDDANQVVQAVRNGGVVVDLPGSISAARPGVRVISDYIVQGNGARLELLSRLIDDGRLRLEFHKAVPFEHAPDALAMVLGKHVRGKVALAIS